MSVHLQYLPHLQRQQLGTLALGRRYTKSSINHTRSYNMQRMRSSMLGAAEEMRQGALLRTHVGYEPGDQMGWWTHYLQSWNLNYTFVELHYWRAAHFCKVRQKLALNELKGTLHVSQSGIKPGVTILSVGLYTRQEVHEYLSVERTLRLHVTLLVRCSKIKLGYVVYVFQTSGF